MRTGVLRVIAVLISVNMFIAGLAVLAMLLHVVADVLLRELFNAPFSGTLEIVSYWYMVGLVFLAIPAAQAHGEHIKVEPFTGAASPKLRSGIDIVVLLASAVLLGLFAWVSLGEAITQSERGAVVEAGTGTITIWPTRWLVPLSMASTSLICVAQAIGLAGALIRGEEPTTTIQEHVDV